jgi:hypothetical protein
LRGTNLGCAELPERVTLWITTEIHLDRIENPKIHDLAIKAYKTMKSFKVEKQTILGMRKKLVGGDWIRTKRKKRTDDRGFISGKQNDMTEFSSGIEFPEYPIKHSKESPEPKTVSVSIIVFSQLSLSRSRSSQKSEGSFC